MPNALLLLGRVCLAAVFVVDGWSKLRGFGTAAGALRGQGVPFVQVVLPLIILIELGGGIAIVAGFKARLAAYFLIIYCALINYHSPNFSRAIGGDAQALPVLLNQLAIIGGLFLLAAAGPGRIGLDRS
jgi:putative oxidoreductase